MKKILFVPILVFCISISSNAQTSTETTIDEKFSELITSSNNFKGYKVVDSGELSTLQQLTSNRIAELKEEIANSKEGEQALQENISALQAQVDALTVQLEEVTAEKDAIVFLGMPLSKSTYKSTMWGIIGALLLALVLFIVRFKRSHVHTREARKNLEETEKEFEAFRAKSLEKEQRLGRLLQDEKNKQVKMAKAQ